MQLKLFRKNNWLKFVQFLIVLMATANARLRLPSLTGYVWWFAICFSIALYIACIYEIPIKIGINKGFSKGRITAEVIVVWIIPLFLGYYFSKFLK